MKRWQFWVGVLISAIFIWVALRGLNLAAFVGALKNADYGWLIPGIIVYFGAVWVRAWRWHYLLKPIKLIPTRRVWPITVIGYMGNNVYPARAGEVLRAVLLKRHEGVAVSAALATIIVERIFDGVVMLGFVFFNLSELTQLTGGSGFLGTIQQLAFYGSLAFFGALLAFLVAAMFPLTAGRAGLWIIEHLLPRRFHERAIGIVSRFLDGLASLRSPLNVLMVFLTTVFIWLLETLKYWFVMHAFPMSVSFFGLMLMNGIVNLATTLPSAPGYIGTFDTPGIAVLQAYGVPQAIATGYTLVLHAALWFPITALGLYYLTKEGIQWTELLRAEAETS